MGREADSRFLVSQKRKGGTEGSSKVKVCPQCLAQQFRAQVFGGSGLLETLRPKPRA